MERTPLGDLSAVEFESGRYISVNNTLAHQVGSPKEYFVGKQNRDLIPSNEAEELDIQPHSIGSDTGIRIPSAMAERIWLESELDQGVAGDVGRRRFNEH